MTTTVSVLASHSNMDNRSATTANEAARRVLDANAVRVPDACGTFTIRMVDGQIVGLVSPGTEHLPLAEFWRRYMAEEQGPHVVDSPEAMARLFGGYPSNPSKSSSSLSRGRWRARAVSPRCPIGRRVGTPDMSLTPLTPPQPEAYAGRAPSALPSL